MARVDDYTSNSLPAEGTYPARIAAFVDVGMQETQFGFSRQGKVTIELCGPTAKAGQPIVIYKTFFNLSLKSEKFRDFLKAATNRNNSGFDLRDLIGTGCEATITHRETDRGVYADVEITSCKDATKLPPLVSDPVFFSLIDSDFDVGTLESLPDKLKKRIKDSETYKELMAQRELAKLSSKDIIDDDIPFGWIIAALIAPFLLSGAANII
jgi:hypothetical protein